MPDTGYMFVDNPNPNGRNFYPSRNRPIIAIVLHITAGLEDTDLEGKDLSAEKTMQWGTQTPRRVSWHKGSDSDSVVNGLPDDYTGFHVRNYNSPTLGLEISKKDTTWKDEDPAWVEATLLHAAEAVRPWVKDHNIPVRRTSKAQIDKSLSRSQPTKCGFIGHQELDPSRRRDPGADFPWETFFQMVNGTYKPGTPAPKPKPKPTPKPPSSDKEFEDMRLLKVTSPLIRGDDVEAVQTLLVYKEGISVGSSGIDKYYGKDTERAVRRYQSRAGLSVDGIVGPNTRTKLNGG